MCTRIKFNRIAKRILVALLIIFPMTTVVHAQCKVGNDLLTWDQIAKRPDPPDKPPPGETALNETPISRANTRMNPFFLAGKFLSKVDTDRRYCTAQVVGRTNILLTAAHCVRNKNGVWLHAFEYHPAEPGYTDRPITKARCIVTKSNWKSGNGWYWPADYAFVVLNKPVANEYLVLDPSTATKAVRTIGFPLDIDGGDVLQQGKVPFNRFQFPGMKPGEDFGTTRLSDRRFGLGVSGGGWFVKKNDTSEFVVVGVNASTNNHGPFGPVFGDCAADLLKFAIKSCP